MRCQISRPARSAGRSSPPREQEAFTMRQVNRLSIFSLVTLSLLLAGAPALRSAAQVEPAPAFTEAEIFFELNDTDGDLGIHASIDGGPWTNLAIEGPHERRLLDIVSRGRLRTQGLTQLAFESAEPSFDELAPRDFFRRFPEGGYEIDGRTQDGREIEATAVLSHVMAAPPKVVVSGMAAAEECDVSV